MLGTKKTLIIVYKEELVMNQLKKLIETCDDDENGIVGTKDNSINVVAWDEKVWLSNKKAGNIQGKILFIGEIKGADNLIPIIDTKFDKYGVKFGWAGNQAIVYADKSYPLKGAEYKLFLDELLTLPVPDDIRLAANPKPGKGKTAAAIVTDVLVPGAVVFNTLKMKKDLSELTKQQMFYGVAKLYLNGLEEFMNL